MECVCVCISQLPPLSKGLLPPPLLTNASPASGRIEHFAARAAARRDAPRITNRPSQVELGGLPSSSPLRECEVGALRRTARCELSSLRPGRVTLVLSFTLCALVRPACSYEAACRQSMSNRWHAVETGTAGLTSRSAPSLDLFVGCVIAEQTALPSKLLLLLLRLGL